MQECVGTHVRGCPTKLSYSGLPFACSRNDHAAVCATRTGKVVVVVVVSLVAGHPVEAERILGDMEAR
jgi:hypothetical protein